MDKYQTYKPSGVDWIGEIPKSWEVFKLGNLFSVNGRVGWKNLRSDEYIDEPNFIFLSTPNLKYKNIDFENVNYITQFRYDESPEIKLQTDDIILVKSGSTLGIVNIVRSLPKPSTINGSSVILRKKSTNELSSFYHYFFSSHYFQNLMNITQGGVGVPSVNQSDINNFKIIKLSLKEQHHIVQFLDKKTELIDKLISTKERKITLLKEQRTSFINQVVTKGLNPNVKMKDSGVEWIGEIPESWEIIKLKYLVTFDSGYSFNSSDYVDEGVNLIRIGSLYDNTLSLERSPVFLPNHFLNQYQNFVVKKNDILISLTGTLGKRDYGYSIVYDRDFPSLLNQRVGRLKLKSEGLNFKLLTSILHSEYYLNQLFCKPTGTKQGNFSSDDIVSNYIFIPLVQEQLQIVQHLNSKTKEIDDLVRLEQNKIDLLKEYRQSLISEVVTGKIKVTTNE
jgi:type I restriction enzyme, S subunit